MATLRPFRGLRYTPEAGNLKNLVAPPYDVISPQYREDLASRSPYNYVHLTLPEGQPDDRSQFVKYTRSAALLAEWRRSHILVPEGQPAFYKYVQTFPLPGIATPFVRTALLTLLKVEPYEKGIVLPHERTFPKHKADRLHLLEATRTHLESIFGLYEDPGHKIHNLVSQSTAGAGVEVLGDDGVHNRLEPIVEPEAVQAIESAFLPQKVWIADGHHRYETALGFRQSLGEHADLIPEDFLVIALTSIEDPGLVLLPTHRMAPKLPMTQAEAKAKLETVFTLDSIDPEMAMALMEQEKAAGNPTLAVVFSGGESYLLKIKNHSLALSLMGDEGSKELRGLDVSLLHRVVLGSLLDLPSPDQVQYTRSEEEAINLAKSGSMSASFLMQPPTVDDMRTLALQGEKMPQKSTYYYPKILSGLTAWSLSDGLK